MSLSRLALRLLAIEAIREHPVLADALGGRVFDSSMRPFDTKEPMPVVIVTTEALEGAGASANNGGPPFKTEVDLLFEIAIRAFKFDDSGEPVSLDRCATDAELEASLDTLEHLLVDQVAAGSTPNAALLRRHVLRRVSAVSSHRMPADDIGQRMAERIVKLTCDVKDVAAEMPADGSLPPALVAIRDAAPAPATAGVLITAIETALSAGAHAQGELAGVDMTMGPRPQMPEPPPTKTAVEADGTAVKVAAATETTP